jgi:hypothetical protein
MRVVPDKFMLYHQSLDSYLFLRFLRTLIFICIVGACITWPILMPINATGGGNAKELNRISIGNVKEKHRLYAHATVAWVFFGFVMFTVARERLWLIGLRQAWNLSKTNAMRLSSRTVLFLSAPIAALDESNKDRFFGKEAVRVWPATKADKLRSLVSSRNSLVEELESAELSLIQKANERGRKRQSKNNRREITYESLSEVNKSTVLIITGSSSRRSKARLKEPGSQTRTETTPTVHQLCSSSSARKPQLNARASRLLQPTYCP